MNEPAKNLINQYRDAYLTTYAIGGIATLLKSVGVLAFLGCLAAGAMTQEGLFVALGAGAGLLIALVFLALGILVATIGQLLRTSLDTTICVAPFLSDGEKEKLVLTRKGRVPLS